MLTTLVKTPLRQSSLFFNGLVLCHTEVFVSFSPPPQNVVICGCRDGAFLSRLFILHSGKQVLHGGQLTVNHLLSLFWEWGGALGELDCDGWCWEAFSYWPKKLDHIVSYQEKMPHKSMSIWPINIAAKGYLCIIGSVTGHVQIDSSAWMPCMSVEVNPHKWPKI